MAQKDYQEYLDAMRKWMPKEKADSLVKANKNLFIALNSAQTPEEVSRARKDITKTVMKPVITGKADDVPPKKLREMRTDFDVFEENKNVGDYKSMKKELGNEHPLRLTMAGHEGELALQANKLGMRPEDLKAEIEKQFKIYQHELAQEARKERIEETQQARSDLLADLDSSLEGKAASLIVPSMLSATRKAVETGEGGIGVTDIVADVGNGLANFVPVGSVLKFGKGGATIVNALKDAGAEALREGLASQEDLNFGSVVGAGLGSATLSGVTDKVLGFVGKVPPLKKEVEAINRTRQGGTTAGSKEALQDEATALWRKKVNDSRYKKNLMNDMEGDMTKVDLTDEEKQQLWDEVVKELNLEQRGYHHDVNTLFTDADDSFLGLKPKVKHALEGLARSTDKLGIDAGREGGAFFLPSTERTHIDTDEEKKARWNRGHATAKEMQTQEYKDWYKAKEADENKLFLDSLN